MSMVEIMAHRGYSGKYPENTLLAFAQACALNVDSIELDVHKTRDNQLIVNHDPIIHGTWFRKQRIADLNAIDLQKLPLKRKQKAPLLSEVLDLLKKMNQKINIELKGPQTEQLTYEVVKQKGFLNRVIYCSFYLDRILLMKKIDPNVIVGIIKTSIALEERKKILQEMKSLGISYINLHYANLDQDFVSMIHKEGLKVNVWTIDTEKVMKKFMSMNVDIITTNRPDILKRILI